MRIWCKLFKDNHMLKDYLWEDFSDDTRTHKVFAALDKTCHEFDLSTPVWLQKNIKDFKKLGHTRFGKDNFIEEIEFDYLEFRVIEED